MTAGFVIALALCLLLGTSCLLISDTLIWNFYFSVTPLELLVYFALDLGTFLRFPFVMYKCHVINWNLFCRDVKVLIKPVNKHKLKVGYSVHFTDPYTL